MIEPVRVFILYARQDSAQRYRCQHLQQQLRLYGVTCHIGDIRRVSLAELSGCQFVIYHRVPSDRNVERQVRALRESGCITLFDTDDLIFDQSLLNHINSLVKAAPIRICLYRREVELYRRLMEQVDGILVSTDFLARQVAFLGKPVQVHRNAFSLEMYAASSAALMQQQRDSRKTIIGYASGTPTHDQDFQVIKPVLQQLLLEHREIELQIIGHLDPGNGWGKTQSRIRHLPFVSWQELPGLLSGFDINLAPLEIDNPFCQAKSEIKYVEAGLVRIPTIASRTDAYSYAIQHGINGLLASTHQEWLDCLEQLVENVKLRQAMGGRAYQDVQACYQPIVRGRELIQMLNEFSLPILGQELFPVISLPDLSTTRNNDPGPGSVAAPSLWLRFWYALRFRPPGMLLMQILFYLRKRLKKVTEHRADLTGN